MKKFLKWTGIILAGLLGLFVISMGVVYLMSNARMSKTYPVTIAAVAVPTDSASIEEGQRLFVTRGCPDCHGPDGAGAMLLDDPMIWRFAGPNLTAGQGGVGAELTDADWERAIRHGIGPDLKPLLIIPSNEYYPMTDRDVGMLIAYGKSLPPVDQASITNQVGPLGRVLLVTNMAPFLSAEIIDHSAPRLAEAPKGVNLEFGAYLAVSCVGCHGAGLSGGPIPGDPGGPPFPSNLTSDLKTGLGNWSEADFITAIRLGTRPDGTMLSDKMPWKGFSLMTDEELKALWLYLRSVPAQEYGNR